MMTKNKDWIQRPYKMRRRFEALEIPALKAAALLAPALVWEILSRSGFPDPQFVPSFFQALGGIVQAAQGGLLLGSIIISLWRAMTGLLLASAVAVPLGLCVGRDASGLGDCFNPLFRLLAQVNPFALAPIFILFLGIGESAKAGIVAWVCFWPIFFNTLGGARSVDPILIKTARGMAASGPVLFFTVILPGAASSIFTGLKLGLEMSFFVLIAAEMIGASSGIGWLVQAAYWNMRFAWMYGAMILAIALGFCMNGYLNRLYDRVFFWREEPAGPGLFRRRPFTPRDLAGAVALLLLIFIAGLWQIRETRREWQSFGKEGQASPSGLGIFDD
jgi:NitT/TauT family transport system permease protein